MRLACRLALESKRLFSWPIALSSSLADARSHRFTLSYHTMCGTHRNQQRRREPVVTNLAVFSVVISELLLCSRPCYGKCRCLLYSLMLTVMAELDRRMPTARTFILQSGLLNNTKATAETKPRADVVRLRSGGQVQPCFNSSPWKHKKTRVFLISEQLVLSEAALSAFHGVEITCEITKKTLFDRWVQGSLRSARAAAKPHLVRRQVALAKTVSVGRDRVRPSGFLVPSHHAQEAVLVQPQAGVVLG